MRSAAVLLCTRRRSQRRLARCASRERPRTPHRTILRDGDDARRASRRASPRVAKPRARIVHVIPRGFLPLIRH
jgi:hypothetical protein